MHKWAGRLSIKIRRERGEQADGIARITCDGKNEFIRNTRQQGSRPKKKGTVKERKPEKKTKKGRRKEGKKYVKHRQVDNEVKKVELDLDFL